MCVFQCTLSGYGCIRYRRRVYRIEPGHAFVINLINPEVTYYYPEDAREPWSFVYCVFTNMHEIVTEMNEIHGPIFEFATDSPIPAALLQILDRDTLPFSIPSHTSFALCSEIIGEMSRQIQQEGQAAPTVAQLARTQIQSERFLPFSLNRLADALDVTPEHLCREFRKHLNCTPKRYHERLQIQEICGRLMNSAASLKQIAAELGFNDLSNFNRFFRKHCAISPRSFRQSGGSHHIPLL